MSDGYLMPEIRKSIRLGWAAFGKVENILKNNNTSMAIKKKVFNEYVLPVMTYDSYTRALNNTIMEKLAVAQRNMVQIMLGITLKIRNKTAGSDHIQELLTSSTALEVPKIDG